MNIIRILLYHLEREREREQAATIGKLGLTIFGAFLPANVMLNKEFWQVDRTFTVPDRPQ